MNRQTSWKNEKLFYFISFISGLLLDCVPYPIKHVQCLVTNWRDSIQHMLWCKLFLLISSRLMSSCHELWRWMFVYVCMCFIIYKASLITPVFHSLEDLHIFKAVKKGFKHYTHDSNAEVQPLWWCWKIYDCAVCVIQSWICCLFQTEKSFFPNRHSCRQIFYFFILVPWQAETGKGTKDKKRSIWTKNYLATWKK